ncbi:MAG: hydantoinase/oxoprolinase family protein [Candidatus Poribacteria bacterium]
MKQTTFHAPKNFGAARQTFRVGVDIGGTFTDIVLMNQSGDIITKKLSSTVESYESAIIAGLQELFSQKSINGESISEIIHATTVATNAILGLKGAKTGLITTKGFRDVLEIRRLRMPQLYNLAWEKPQPLVPRFLRLEVDERINFRGGVVKPLDESTVKSAAARLLKHGVESVAVCLLNAYVNDVHERRVAGILRSASPKWHISLSSEILPEIKEYERASTTVINAYIMPIVIGYLTRLATGLSEIGINTPLLVMQSNGGVMLAKSAAKKPIHIIESGPAAGVMASAILAQKCGYPNILTFDMGGTTAKASIIENGQLTRISEYEVGGGISLASRLIRGGGYALKAPAIDVAEVGAGGGSIVHIDSGGALQVGPQSAGSFPGPVCYDIGGEEPTITDANLVLGYLNPDYLLNGELKVNFDKAYHVIESKIARPLNMDVLQAAYGIHLIGSSNMMRAIRAVSSERGRNPADFVLFAFGGSGPVHAVQMANQLEITKVLIPPTPGLFSALGLLFSDMQYHHVRTCLRKTDELTSEELQTLFATMEHEAMKELNDLGYSQKDIDLLKSVDLRYVGQSHELMLPIDAKIGRGGIRVLQEQFATEHERTYGHRAQNDPIEIVNLRLVACVKSQKVDYIPDFNRSYKIAAHEVAISYPDQRRKAYFGEKYGQLDVEVITRESLSAGARQGPLIIEEYDSTIVVPPGWNASLDKRGNVLITR